VERHMAVMFLTCANSREEARTMANVSVNQHQTRKEGEEKEKRQMNKGVNLHPAYYYTAHTQ